MLIEHYDIVRSGNAKAIVERFHSSEDIKLISSIELNPDEVPSVVFLHSRLDKKVAVSDLRGSWQLRAWMVPKECKFTHRR